MIRKKLSALLLLLPLYACTVGPNYKRPAVDVPGQYRGLAPDTSTQPTGKPFAELQWSAVFQDEVLQSLIKEALTNNYDIRIAAARILEAGAVLGITRANQFPSVDVGGSLGNTRTQPFPGKFDDRVRRVSRLRGYSTSGDSIDGRPRRHAPTL